MKARALKHVVMRCMERKPEPYNAFVSLRRYEARTSKLLTGEIGSSWSVRFETSPLRDDDPVHPQEEAE